MTLRFFADVRSEGLQLVDSYSQGITPHAADRAYRRFAAFVHQAENYYRSARALPYRSSALLYYYAFMNLAKAALAVRDLTFKEVHGLTPDYGAPPTTLASLHVKVRWSGIFQALYSLILSQSIQNVNFPISSLLAYVSELAVQYDQATPNHPKVVRYARSRVLQNNNQQEWLLLALPDVLPITAQPTAVQAAFNARFQQVVVHPNVSRELFNLFIPESLGFVYYQSFPMVPINTNFTTHTQYVLDALPGCVHPIYLEDERSDFVITEHCAATDASTWPMNEMCAIYLSMFFMGSLVRYRPDLLEELLGTSAAWLLESFVNAAPLLFLRLITCVILNRMILFNR